MQDSSHKKPRIDIVTGIILFFLALVFDIMQTGALALVGLVAVNTLGVGVAPGIAVGALMNFAGMLFFGGTFWYLGVNYFKVKHAASGIFAALIEFIPFINILPAWTSYVVTTIIITRIEDGDSVLAKTALKATKAAKGEIDFKEEPRNKRKKRERAEEEENEDVSLPEEENEDVSLAA